MSPKLEDLMGDTENPEAHVVIFTFCCALTSKPTHEQQRDALAQLIRVAREGMKLDVITAQVVCMTEAQARKAFEEAEMADATEEASRVLKS